MPIHTRRALLAATVGTAFIGALSNARADDRPVTPEERRQIEATLRREGFMRWGGIEFDDGHFEVADAVAADGKTYDLELSSVDFTITSRDLDD